MSDKKGKYEKLSHEPKSAWETLEKKDEKTVFAINEDYKKFLNENKTERQIVKTVEKIAIKKGFVNINKATKSSKKIYAINHEKNIALIDLTKGKLENGLRILGAHIDSLRLDLKLNPVYESEPFALVNLHYYGGLKKYHWLNLPLSLHGVVFDKDGKKTEIEFGEKESEPVLVITDLLPHLEGREYATKKATDIIKGEAMDAIGASRPVDDKNTKEKLKAQFLTVLNKKYGITEEDFVSADLSLYPANKARDVGVDSAMIGAPAHDDRVCSYFAVRAILDSKPNFPSAALLVDKEEIGSTGNTAMSSKFFENLINKIIKIRGDKTTALEVLENSKAISADVTSGLDPKFADKMDPYNLNKPGYGISVEKGTGSGGKYNGSEASAEFMSFMRQLLNKAKVTWQYGEMGKVDQGGGGTIAHILAEYNMDIVDAGPPVLAMHSPFELVSKIDTFQTYKAYKAFLEIK